MKKNFKKSVALICSAIIAVTAVSCFSVSANTESVLYGDLNGDNTVDIRDVTYIQKVLVNSLSAPENFYDVADVFKDSSVDVRDVTVLQEYIAGKHTALPIKVETTTEASTTIATETTKPVPATDPDGWILEIIKP